MTEIFFSAIDITKHLKIFLKRISKFININKKIIAAENFFIELPIFTDLNCTIKTKDFIAICEAVGPHLTILDSSLKMEYKKSNFLIEKYFHLYSHINYFQLNNENLLLSVELPNLFLKKIALLNTKFIFMRIENKKIIIESDDYAKVIMEFFNCEMLTMNIEKTDIQIKTSDLKMLNIKFEKRVLCIFDSFAVIFLYEKDLTYAVQLMFYDA